MTSALTAQDPGHAARQGSGAGDEDVTIAAPALLMDKDTSTPNVIAGGQATYQIVVQNSGGSAATGVTVADTLPAGFTYASSSVVETSATRTAPDHQPDRRPDHPFVGHVDHQRRRPDRDHLSSQRARGDDAGDVRQHGQRRRQQPRHHR